MSKVSGCHPAGLMTFISAVVPVTTRLLAALYTKAVLPVLHSSSSLYCVSYHEGINYFHSNYRIYLFYVDINMSSLKAQYHTGRMSFAIKINTKMSKRFLKLR